MKLPDRETCYRAPQGRDSRFDGLFYVGVTSTDIYCRPVCPARTAKLKNCRYFSSAAEAQEAGLRPCLRCRPETALVSLEFVSDLRLTRVFPGAERLAVMESINVAMPAERRSALKELAAAVVADPNLFRHRGRGSLTQRSIFGPAASAATSESRSAYV
jgi:methylphosphotriester-DNA--protein-cysteine methyltransferase